MAFENISTEEFNDLMKFISDLPEPYSAFLPGSDSERDLGGSSGFHGAWNDGSIEQEYRPHHPIPKVEAEMQ